MFKLFICDFIAYNIKIEQVVYCQCKKLEITKKLGGVIFEQ